MTVTRSGDRAQVDSATPSQPVARHPPASRFYHNPGILVLGGGVPELMFGQAAGSGRWWPDPAVEPLQTDIHWIHNLDPVAVHLGPLAIRWYGLAYLAAFAAVYLGMLFFARIGTSRLPKEKVSDFVTFGALFGVLLGGRLGYALFYDPGLLLAFTRQFPYWEFLALNHGGMASHGGVLGLFFFTLWFSLRHKIPWANLGDHLVIGSTIGLFVGRLANFVNGELYGRAAPALAWAMKFPQELIPNPGHPGLGLPDPVRAAAERAALRADPTLAQIQDETFHTQVIDRMRDNDTLRETVGRFLTPRHPSQLYEALLEGFALFAILFVVRMRFRRMADGVLTGLFFVLYAVFRIAVEQFREPDAAMVGPLTKGQFYSAFMILIGIAFLVWSARHPRPDRVPAP